MHLNDRALLDHDHYTTTDYYQDTHDHEHHQLDLLELVTEMLEHMINSQQFNTQPNDDLMLNQARTQLMNDLPAVLLPLTVLLVRVVAPSRPLP